MKRRNELVQWLQAGRRTGARHPTSQLTRQRSQVTAQMRYPPLFFSCCHSAQSLWRSSHSRSVRARERGRGPGLTLDPRDRQSSVEAVGGCSPGLVTFNPDHAESRRVHVDSGRFAWECNKNDSLGHWIKISDRTVHVSGTVGYEERKGGGGGESDRGTGEDVEMQNVGTVGRRRKVLETALVGGWMLCDGSAGSLFHLVPRKERGGPVVIMAGGNWSMVECCVRVRPGPHRPGHYPKAAAWLVPPQSREPCSPCRRLKRHERVAGRTRSLCRPAGGARRFAMLLRNSAAQVRCNGSASHPGAVWSSIAAGWLLRVLVLGARV